MSLPSSDTEEDPNANGDDIPEATIVTTPPKKNRVYQQVFSSDTPRWVNQSGQDLFDFGEDEDAAVEELAFECFGGSKVNGCFWKHQNFKTTYGNSRRVLYCGFYHASGCEFRVEQVRDSILNKCYFRIGNIGHSNHDRILKNLRTVPPQVKVTLDSPTCFKLRPEQFIQRCNAKQVVEMTNPMKKKIKVWFHSSKKKYLKQGLKHSRIGTYGALTEVLESLKKTKIPTAKFTDHTVYLVGDRFHLNIEERKYCAVLSTENLLLNAYRQLCYGNDMFFSIDTSFRYTVEGFALMPVFVIAPTMEGHRVGYALVAKDDTETHYQALQLLKEGVEEVVNDRIAKGHTEV